MMEKKNCKREEMSRKNEQILLLADNLNGGAARLVERFLDDWIFSNKDNEDHLYIVHSNNIVLPRHCKIKQYAINRSKIFIIDYIKRCYYINKINDVSTVLNFSNFPIPEFLNFTNKIQILILHNAYVLSNPICYEKLNLKFRLIQLVKRFFFCFMLFISRKINIVVQTFWMKDNINKILNQYRIKNNIFVVPYEAHIYKDYSIDDPDKELFLKNIEKIKPFWFYPSAYYPHKNHQFIIELAKKIKQEGNRNNLKIVTTINSNYSNKNKFLRDIILYGLEDIIVNIGWISQNEANHYLIHAEGLLFPSTFESLGIPLLEAVSFNKKIIAADIPTTKELLLDYAKYFNILDKNSSNQVYEEMLQDFHPNNRHLNFKRYNIYEAYYKNFFQLLK